MKEEREREGHENEEAGHLIEEKDNEYQIEPQRQEEPINDVHQTTQPTMESFADGVPLCECDQLPPQTYDCRDDYLADSGSESSVFLSFRRLVRGALFSTLPEAWSDWVCSSVSGSCNNCAREACKKEAIPYFKDSASFWPCPSINNYVIGNELSYNFPPPPSVL